MGTTEVSNWSVVHTGIGTRQRGSLDTGWVVANEREVATIWAPGGLSDAERGLSVALRGELVVNSTVGFATDGRAGHVVVLGRTPWPKVDPVLDEARAQALREARRRTSNRLIWGQQVRLPDTSGYELVCAGTVGGAGSVLVVSSAGLVRLRARGPRRRRQPLYADPGDKLVVFGELVDGGEVVVDGCDPDVNADPLGVYDGAAVSLARTYRCSVEVVDLGERRELGDERVPTSQVPVGADEVLHAAVTTAGFNAGDQSSTLTVTGGQLHVTSARSGQVRFAFPVASVKVVGVRSVPVFGSTHVLVETPAGKLYVMPAGGGDGDLERFAERLTELLARAGSVPAGWYPDTEVPGGLRWWDGDGWTEHRHEAGGDRR